MTIKISIDCMGGDHGLSVTIPAAISFSRAESNVELILVGPEAVIRGELEKRQESNNPRLSIVNATEVVEMGDSIEVALRRKRDSSMRVTVRLVKDGLAHACVSAGNTGALMAVSRYVLKTIPGVDRPAICTLIPNQKGVPTYMLDLGANVDCEPQHLHQFALMGSALVSALEGRPNPSVGLLNIGEEDIKGNEAVKQTAALLRADHERGILNFHGNVEGNDIFEGTTDLVVCDGFVGNVVLKASEGLARFFKTALTAELKNGPINMLGALIASGGFKSFSERMNPSRLNGASLLGLRGLVFKSHGGEGEFGYECAIKRAYDAASHGALAKISTTIAELMAQPSNALDSSMQGESLPVETNEKDSA